MRYDWVCNAVGKVKLRVRFGITVTSGILLLSPIHLNQCFFAYTFFHQRDEITQFEGTTVA